ncbi:MAG: hypothetical protein U9R48_09095 [Chloroflexota bacterium]|nr:hypothetical protein [Chloroflexota bacterium]
MLRSIWRRLASGLLVLLAIAYLSFLLQGFAVHTRMQQSFPPAQVFRRAVVDTVALCRGMLRGDVGSYDSGYWYSVPKPLSTVVGVGTGASAVVSSVTSERLMRVLRKSAQGVDLSLKNYGTALHTGQSLYPLPDLTIPSATVSWLGSDALAHTPQDTSANVDAEKVGHIGEIISLAVMVLASDPAY